MTNKYMYKDKKQTAVTDGVIMLFRHIHGDKYDYSKFKYVGATVKSTIICPIHGEFEMSYSAHKKGQGCLKCGIGRRAEKKMMTNDEFIRRASEVHGDKYDYSKVEYTGIANDVTIVCPKHGEFTQRAGDHLNGHGCLECANTIKRTCRLIEPSVWIERFKETHGDKYNYSKSKIVGGNNPITIICPEHGEFEQTPRLHLVHGCPKCGMEKTVAAHSLGKDGFIKRAREVHGDKYDYSKVEYTMNQKPVTIICPKHGEFQQIPHYHLSGCGCQLCASEMKASVGELDMYRYIRDAFNGEVKKNVRKPFKGKLEMDVYIPSLDLAFEYNGLYWHNEHSRSKDYETYHRYKSDECSKLGIRLVHFYEDEWLYKKEIVKSVISRLTVPPTEVPEIHVKKIGNHGAEKFIEYNSLLPYRGCDVAYGTFIDDVLIAVATFISFGENSWELTGFAERNDTNYQNLMSVLIRQFEEDEKPSSLMTYCEVRLETPETYENIGFTKVDEVAPDYTYVIHDKRKPRSEFETGDMLIDGCSEELHKELKKNAIYRIYDCGKITYKKEY